VTKPDETAPDLRPTPFALALPDPNEAERRFAAIAEEARTRGADPGTLEAFVQLGEVALLLDTLRGAEPTATAATATTATTGQGEPPGEGEEGPHARDAVAGEGAGGAERSLGVQGRFAAFLALLHHAYRHHAGWLETGGGAAGPPPLLLDVSMEYARYLVEAMPEGRIRRVPGPSGYLRLPRNLFWVTPGGAGTPPEPLDGISWTTQRVGGGTGGGGAAAGPGGGTARGTEGGTARGPEAGADRGPDAGADRGPEAGTPGAAKVQGELLHLLAVSGIVPGRPGFSAIPLPALALPDVEAWLSQTARDPSQGADFQTTLPGGELGGLYSIETPAELVKLAARAFVASGLPPGEDGGEPSTAAVPGEGFDKVFRWVPLRLDEPPKGARRAAGGRPDAPSPDPMEE
jgi:hypothetical protein